MGIEQNGAKILLRSALEFLDGCVDVLERKRGDARILLDWRTTSSACSGGN
jgi:hypothetical protein